jgi:iron complex outermembrane receptor protein
MRLVGCSLATIGFMLLNAQPAAAQAAKASPANPPKAADSDKAKSPGDSTSGIGDIVITARKQSESSQSVPIAVAAFSAADLATRNVQVVGDLARYTPNVVMDQGASASGGNRSTSIYVRGLGQSDPSAFADPAVAVYIDNVYFGRSVGSMQDIVDLDRVEILKGPQGTLFGKNTMGGAVSVFSKLPTGDLGGTAEVAYGRFNQVDFRLGVEFPITVGLSAKLSVSRRTRDGYTKSLISGQDLDDVNSLVGRAILNWQPKDGNFRFTIIGDAMRVREAAQGFHLVTAKLNPAAPFGGAISIFNTLPNAAPSTPYVAFDNRWVSAGQSYTYATGLIGFCNCTKIDQRGISGTLEWTLTPNVTLTSISAYRNQYSANAIDLDGSPLDFQGNGNESRQHQFSEELRLGGSAFSGRLSWVIGGYYLDEKIDETLHVRIGFAGTLKAVSQDNRVQPFTRTRALFTQETLKLTDQLSITAGIRYSYEQKAVTAQALNLNTNVFLLPPTFKKAKWEAWTPKFGIEFKPGPDALIYASYSKGFKSGGFDYQITTTAFLPYDPEQVSTYEIGFKSDWLGRRLRINGDLFYNDYTDLQLRATVQPGTFNCPATVLPTCSSIVNASTVHIKGAELEVIAKPANGFELFASAGYTDQKFTRIDPVLLATNALNPANGANFSSKLPRTPRWTVNLGAQYQTSLGGNAKLTLRGDYSYRSTTYFDLTNIPALTQPGYGLFNARVAFDFGDKFQLALSGQNLADKRYITAGINSSSFNFASVHYGLPRTWTLSAKYKF